MVDWVHSHEVFVLQCWNTGGDSRTALWPI